MEKAAAWVPRQDMPIIEAAPPPRHEHASALALMPGILQYSGAHAVQYADLPLHYAESISKQKAHPNVPAGWGVFSIQAGLAWPHVSATARRPRTHWPSSEPSWHVQAAEELPRPCIRTHVRRVRARARAHHPDVLSTCIALARGAGQHQPGARGAHVQSASIHQQYTRRVRNDLCVEVVEICALSKIMLGNQQTSSQV